MKYTFLLLQISFLLLLCFEPSITALGQSETKQRTTKTTKPSSPTNAVLADARTLTSKEREFCLKVLKALDSSDAIFVTGQDPHRFRDSLNRVTDMVDDVDDKLREGTVKNTLLRTAQTYLDLGVLITLGATRHKKGKVEISNEQAENLSEMKRDYKKLLGNDLAPDLLDADNIAKIYEHGLKLKEGLYEALK